MKTKRKILFVVHQLNYGGVQKAAIAALNAIDYSENEVTLYVRKNRTQLLKDVNKHVSKIIVNEDKTHYYRKPYAIYLTICESIGKWIKNSKLEEKAHKRLVQYIVKSQMKYEQKQHFKDTESYDVAISYIQGYSAQFVAECVDAKKKIMFYHVSGDELHELHEKIISSYNYIVGVNASVQQMLQKEYRGYQNRIKYIDHWIDVEQILKMANEPLDIKKYKEIMICSCGRLTSEKGFDLAIQAARTLKQKEISFSWYFIGDGAQKQELIKMIEEYDLEEEITITGIQENPYNYMKMCDVYVQPSYEESFGLSIAEAKILCKPIVSTCSVGAKLQMIDGTNGILTEVDGESIANGILQYIQNPNLRMDVITELEKTDYEDEYIRYREKWRDLLNNEI